MQHIDGRPVTASDLQALALVGLGHFTTLRVQDGGVRGLDLHLRRLARDARDVFQVGLDEDLVRRHIRRAIADEPADVIVRITLFDPSLSLAHPGGAAAPRMLVTPRAVGGAEPMRVRSAAHEREHPRIKHVGLFGALRERRLAQQAGFDDAVFVDRAGLVTEGPTWNVGFVRAGRVIWPEADALDGVTRALLDDHGTPEPVTLDDARRMDAAFALSAGVGVRPIASLDDAIFRVDDPALARLREAYAAIPAEPV